MRPRSLMTAYCEGSIISRELRDMLNDEAASARFERELERMDGADTDRYYAGREYGKEPC